MKMIQTASRQLRWTGMVLVLLLGTAGAADEDMCPQVLVRDTSSRMLAALRDEKEAIAADAGYLYELVAEIVLPSFDFLRLSQWVLGRNWRTATESQRAQFVEQFRRLLVRTYGSALSEYADEKIIYLPFAGAGDARTVTVRTEIEQVGAPIPISYSMYRSPDGWKVYDAVANGASAVAFYRSYFTAALRRHGPDIVLR